LEQRHPKGGLQIAHLLREGGLRNSEAVCGAAEAPNLGHGEKIAQVAQLHGIMHHRNTY